MGNFRGLVIFLLAILIVPLVFASPNLEIKKEVKNEVIISELRNSATFDFIIDNKGSEDNYEVYSLVGFSMTPKGTFTLPQGVTRMEIGAVPEKDIAEKSRGYYIFEYELRGQSSGILKDSLMVKIVSLEKVVDLKINSVLPGDDNVQVVIINKENILIDNLKINLESKFFKAEKIVNVNPYESKTFNISINKDKIEGLIAGNYGFDYVLELKGTKIKGEGKIVYLEKEGISVEKNSSGLLVRKTTIKKTNEGNIPVKAEIEITHTIIGRLFTTNNANPDNVTRNGLLVDYSWSRNLDPNESLIVSSSTNYTFPFLAVLAIIIFAVLLYLFTDVILKKRVSFVKTKGGEFALKIILRVKSKKNINNVEITDHVPGIMSRYNKFGKQPDGFDEKTGVLFWKIGSLNSGEERVFSYVVYSKLKAVGNFELPIARAVYEKEGKKLVVSSNRVSFVSETTKFS